MLLPVAFQGCLSPSDPASVSDLTSSPSPSPSIAGGPMAAQIIFTLAATNSTSGSFDQSALPAGGTHVGVGSGMQVDRVFDAAGNLLGSGGPTSSTWNVPWLSGFEIGISGANNTSATNPNCARFAATGETANCTYGSSSQSCAAPPGVFRVSEWDCVNNGTIATGTSIGGGPNAGVYIRATFNRSNLGSTENMMAVVQYAASALNPAPANPTTCFNSTTHAYDPTVAGCSDMTWDVFLSSLTNLEASATQPFLLFIPPTLASVNTTAGTGGSGIAAKQIILPLASDSSLNVMQISRINGLAAGSANYNAACNPDSLTAANSPFCVGVVIYSITFYRI